MARTLSTMAEIGSTAADFNLPDFSVSGSGKNISLADYQQKPLLVLFMCNHCPFVVHIADKLTQVCNQAQQDGLAVVAISSNDIEEYPQDGPELMTEFAKNYGFEFAYCLDESQQVAKAYGAACTPDFFLYDSDHSLVYRGQFDAARPGNEDPVTGGDLQAAITALLNETAISPEQTPSVGCNIKWRAGNEPEYFNS